MLKKKKKKKKKLLMAFVKKIAKFRGSLMASGSSFHLSKVQNVNKELESGVGGRETERTEGEQDKNSIRLCPNKMSVLG